MRKTGKLLLLLLLLAAAAGLCARPAFAAHGGETGHWGAASIERWNGYGVVEVSKEGNPDSMLTRAELAAILSNMLGLSVTANNPFTDIPMGAWYEDAVLRCAAAGILLGDGGRAMPDKTASRQEGIVMVARALGTAPAEEGTGLSFFDAKDVADWAVSSVAAMAERGAVSGVGGNRLEPSAVMSRASFAAILDRAITLYINAAGTYELPPSAGLVLVAAGNVALTGETYADILIAPAADGQDILFDHAKVNGGVTVWASEATVTSRASTLPEVTVTGRGATVTEEAGQTASPPEASGSGGEAEDGDVPRIVSSDPNLLTIRAEGAYSGIYDGVVISDEVGNGNVTLDDMTIHGNLTVQGGGSDSVHVNHSYISGSIILNKAGIDGSEIEAPRLVLNGTDASDIQALAEAIVEADGAGTVIGSVSAEATLTIRGAQTQIGRITVPAAAVGTVAVTVAGGQIGEIVADGHADIAVGDGRITTVTANSEITLALADGGAGFVNAIAANASVSVDSAAVGRIVVPQSAPAGLEIHVAGDAGISIQVDSADGVKIETENDILIDVDGEGRSSSTVSVADGAAAPPKEYIWIEIPAEKATATGVRELLGMDGALDALADTDVPQPCAASCTADGRRAFAALDGDAAIGCVFKTERVDQTAHTPLEVAAVEATCTREGKTAHTVCAVCGAELTSPIIIAATGHDWDMENGQVTRAPTCSRCGTWTYSCKHDAEHTMTADIPIDPDAHEWGEAREITETDIWRYITQDTVIIDGEEVAWDTENLAEIQDAYRIRICVYDEIHYELVPVK